MTAQVNKNVKVSIVRSDGIDELSISVDVREISSATSRFLKVDMTTPDKILKVNFSLQRLGIAATMNSKLSTIKRETISDHCRWEFQKNIWTLLVDTAAFVEKENALPSRGLCQVFTLQKKVVGVLLFSLSVEAPLGYRYVRSPRLSVSPDPVPHTGRDTARRLHLSSGRSVVSTATLGGALEPMPPSSGLIGVVSSPSSGARPALHSTSTSCFTIDDSNKTDVVMSFFPRNFADTIFTACGTIFQDVGYTLSLLYDPPRAAVDEDEQLFLDGLALNRHDAADYNVVAQWMTVGLGEEVLQIHFNSTRCRPVTALSHHRPLSARVEPPSARRRSVVVAECKGMRCGKYTLDFSVTRSVVLPLEEEVYTSLLQISSANLFNENVLEDYSRQLEERYAYVLSLSEEDIAHLQMMIWSALRRCIFSTAKPFTVSLNTLK